MSNKLGKYQIFISPCIGGVNIDLIATAKRKYESINNVVIDIIYNEAEIKNKEIVLIAQLGYKWEIPTIEGETNIDLNIMRNISEFNEIMDNMLNPKNK